MLLGHSFEDAFTASSPPTGRIYKAKKGKKSRETVPLSYTNMKNTFKGGIFLAMMGKKKFKTLC